MICEVETEWTADAERERIASDQYSGTMNNWVCWIYKRLPSNHSTYDDLWSIVKIWALEAVNLYKPEFGTKFNSFLTGHLRLCCMKYLQREFSRSRLPKGRRVFQHSEFDTTSGTRARKPRARSEPTADGTKTKLLDEIHSYRYLIGAGMRIAELRESLSAQSQACFDVLMNMEDQQELCRRFRRRSWRLLVPEFTGLDESTIETFREEIRDKMEQFV